MRGSGPGGGSKLGGSGPDGTRDLHKKAPNGIRIRESRLQTRILDRNRNLQHEFANSGSNWDSDLRVWAADLKSHPRPKSAASIRRFWLQLGLEFASPGCRLEVSSETEICSLSSQILSPIRTRVRQSWLEMRTLI